MLSKYRRIEAGISFGVASIACLLYLYEINQISYNFPNEDDYNAILGFLNHFLTADYPQRFLLLFSQHVDHRLLLTHLISLADYRLFGVINFRHLIWLGNLGWFSVIIFLYLTIRPLNMSLAAFMPVVVLLFSFSQHEMMTWAMASIQQTYQLLFCLISLFCMLRQRVLECLLFFLIGVFTSMGALAIAPVITLYYLTQKQWKNLLSTVLVITLAISAYFFMPGFKHREYQSTLSFIFENPWLPIEFFLSFIGAIAGVNIYGTRITIFFGLLLTIFFIFKAKIIYAKNPLIFWTITFITFIGLMGAVGRSIGGAQAGGSSRYTIYSMVLCSSLYCFYYQTIGTAGGRRLLMYGGMLFAIAINIAWYPHAHTSLIRRQQNLIKECIIHPDPKEALKILEKSKELKIYLGPRHLFNANSESSGSCLIAV
jgi:hypothetical protein